MKADKYLESIGLGNVIGEEFFNDDDKSWYTVQEIMEAYHQGKLDLLTIPVVSQQRELLLAFAKHRNIYTDEMQELNEIDVDEFLKANNCG